MQEEYGRSPRNLDYTWVSEVFPPKRDEPIATGQGEAENAHPKQEAQSPQPKPEAEPARTPIAEVPAQPDVSVEVVQPTTPKTIDLTLSIKIPEGEAEPDHPAKSGRAPAGGCARLFTAL